MVGSQVDGPMAIIERSIVDASSSFSQNRHFRYMNQCPSLTHIVSGWGFAIQNGQSIITDSLGWIRLKMIRDIISMAADRQMSHVRYFPKWSARYAFAGAAKRIGKSPSLPADTGE
jgi:hypothetical protein